jgi:hypothetical protein
MLSATAIKLDLRWCNRNFTVLLARSCQIHQVFGQSLFWYEKQPILKITVSSSLSKVSLVVQTWHLGATVYTDCECDSEWNIRHSKGSKGGDQSRVIYWNKIQAATMAVTMAGTMAETINDPIPLSILPTCCEARCACCWGGGVEDHDRWFGCTDGISSLKRRDTSEDQWLKVRHIYLFCYLWRRSTYVIQQLQLSLFCTAVRELDRNANPVGVSWIPSTVGVLVLGNGVPSENQLTCRLFLYRLRCAVFHTVCCEKTAEPSSFTYLTIPSNDWVHDSSHASKNLWIDQSLDNSFNLSIIQWSPASFPGPAMHCFRGFLISFNCSFVWLIWTTHVLLYLFMYSIFPAIIAAMYDSLILQSHNHSNYYSDNHNDCQSHHHTQLHYIIHFKLSVSSTVSLSYKNIASCPN